MVSVELITFGGACEVGRSAYVLRYLGIDILLDYGIKLFGTEGKKPEYPIPFDRWNVFPRIALISHAHLDHIGYVPALFRQRRMTWYTTSPSLDIAEILWKDTIKIARMAESKLPFTTTHMRRAIHHWEPSDYHQPMADVGMTFRFYDAGHIMGSAYISMEFKDRTVIYSGDFKLEETRMHRGAEKPPGADVLIMEGTYWDREHPNREEAVKKIFDIIEETLDYGGNVLFPAFAVGRTQELIDILATKYMDTDIPIYVDGMGRQVTKVYLKYPGYLRDYERFRKAVKRVKFITSGRERRKATSKPSIIISTAGMMDGGPVLNHVLNMKPNSTIILTGYQVEGTNGRRLLETGTLIIDEYELKVDFPVYYVDLSAHAGRSDLLKFIESVEPEKIVIVHSEGAKEFAQELNEKGWDAIAPKVGEKVKL